MNDSLLKDNKQHHESPSAMLLILCYDVYITRNTVASVYTVYSIHLPGQCGRVALTMLICCTLYNIHHTL